MIQEKNNGNILFFNVPLHGHVNPTLDLVDELVKRGHKVTYFASDNFRDKVEAIGAVFQGYGNVHAFTTTRDISNIFHTGREMLQAAEKIMDLLLVKKLHEEQYNLILYDVSAVWGNFIGQILKIPSICCFPGFAPQWKGYVKSRTIVTRGILDSWEGLGDMKETRQIRDRIVSKYNIKKISSSKLFGGSELMNIVFTSPYLQPYGEEMVSKFHFIGPILQARKETVEFPFHQLDPANKLIYISMGTLYKPSLSFFKTCIAAFNNKPYNVIISVGKSTLISDLEPIPKNIFLKDYVPQLLVLERTAVFVSHGGMGGINEAMFYNVPMLILPKTIEQQINARRIEELGAGLDMKSQDVGADQILAGVIKLLSSPAYVDATKRISQSFKATGGVAPAALVIEKFLGAGASVVGESDG